MTPAYVVHITTPKKFVLNGLWFGPKKPKRVVIWVHGLGSSMFSKLGIAEALVDGNTAVLTFNNRGHDTVSHLVRTDGRKGGWAGAAHEKFADCVDDIQGALNFVRKQGAKNIFLAGHSTGCQKSVYWAAKKGRGVKGIVLLAPVSDYARALKRYGAAKLSSVERYARALVRRGKPNELIPRSVWMGGFDDAQRFLSLYTSDSIEEIFSYAQPKGKPTTLRRVKISTLVLWAQHDEYADRPAKEIVAWFKKYLKPKDRIVMVPKVKHSFRGAEKTVTNVIRAFMKEV